MSLSSATDLSTVGRRITQTILIIYSILMGIVAYYGVTTADDLFFSTHYRDFLISGKPFPGLSPELDYFNFSWHLVNGRIADKFMPLLMLLPRSVFGVLYGVSVWFILSVGTKLTFGRGALRDVRSIVVATALLFFLPWNDYGLQRCAFLNYVAGLAVAVNWLWLFVNRREASTAQCVVLFLFSIVVGFWHEVFSISLLIVAATSYVADLERFRSRRALCMFVGLCLGTAVIFLSPGFYTRIEEETFLEPIYSFYYMLTGGMVSFSGCTIALILLLSGKVRRGLGLDVKRLTVCVVGLVVLLSLTAFTAYSFGLPARRIWWFSDFLTVVIVARMIDTLIKKRSCVVTSAVLCCVAMLPVLIASVAVQRRIYDEHQEILSQYVESGGGRVYYDTFLLDLDLLYSPLFFQSNLYATYEHPYGELYFGCHKPLFVLPSEFRNLDLRSCRDCGNGLAVTPEGHAIYKMPGAETNIGKYLFYEDGSGKMQDAPVILQPFDQDSVGRFYYISPVFRPWRNDPEIVLPERIE